MKNILAIGLTSLAATSAIAADAKLGNVIAVSRSINPSYAACASALQNLGGGGQIPVYSCRVATSANSNVEIALSQDALTYQNSKCALTAMSQANGYEISVQPIVAGAHFDNSDALDCIHEAFTNGPLTGKTFTIVVFMPERSGTANGR
jgi:hypothetical protein